ncbi:MAG TPA: glycosyltransferase [Jatrophihabitantaceae bacterium]|nr:glycosyltransferase [Jatrophihabitantaceae bacterium]
MSAHGDVKVSVIVALYNTGERLDALVASLDAQTLPRDEFEVILVDDGSSDDTLARARGLARTRPHLVVHTIPNSGWPGRPRNVGLDLARGRYVFFSDHDDAFGERALESVCEMADRNNSDIVYGKLVRVGRTTPYWPVWSQDIDIADPVGVVLWSRTVHKLYRRAFLVEHGIRFREGRIRLEDHEFMARAIPKARVISVLASQPVYYWIHRHDGSNASDSPVALADYWSHYAHVLATWEEEAGPGPLLDQARYVSAIQAFSRFGPAAYLKWSPERRDALFAGVQPMFARHVPAELDPLFPVLKRMRVQALRAGDRTGFDAVQELRTRYSFAVRVDNVSVRAGAVHLRLTMSCRMGDRGVVQVERRAGQALLPADHFATDVTDDARRLGEEELGTAEVSIRHVPSGVEWPVAHREAQREPDRLQMTLDASVDLLRDKFGGQLAPGSWELLVRVQFLGEGGVRRLPWRRKGALPTPLHVGESGHLRFEVEKPSRFGRPRARIRAALRRVKRLLVRIRRRLRARA